MLKEIIARYKQGYQTNPYPKKEPTLPERYRGLLSITQQCESSCKVCMEICPTDAITKKEYQTENLSNKEILNIDMGRCLFCGECVRKCPAGNISHIKEYRLASNTRNGLIIESDQYKYAQPLKKNLQNLFSRSLKLRQVSAAGCNACEADTNVLTTIGFDLGRFGIQFVASPRHADGLLITGPVSENMKLALEKTYEAVPFPKIVICVGTCSISGGPFMGHPEVHNGADSIVPVDLYIPGCPPHPMTILDGLLRIIGRI